MSAELISEQTRGVCVIAATPFADDGQVDYDSIDRLTDFYLEAGVSGMTVLGMMGEANKLSESESRAVMRRFIARADGRVPVVVGVSSSGTDALLSLARDSMEAGAAGVMVTPIPSCRTEEQSLNYYDAVCSGLGDSVPVVLQDYPFSTGVHLSVDTILKIVAAHPQIVMLKHEDWPGLNKLSRLRRSAAEGTSRRISILVGNGGLYLPQELARGADGAMTGFAYPEMLVEVVELFASGNAERGEDVFDRYLPLLRHEAQPVIGIALRKETLKRRGAIRSAFVRAPGPKLSRDDHEELSRLIARLERKLEVQDKAA